jgi:cellulose synthase/poly-beta-1,6-N-acetylglucosamine synthase-like glycosyltransferase
MSQDDHKREPEARLGELLVERGELSRRDLERGLRAHGRSRHRLGEVLVRRGLASRLQVARALAEQAGVPFMLIADRPPERELLERFDPQELARLRLAPITLTQTGRVLVATSERPTERLQSIAEELCGGPVELAMTTEWDIVQYLLRAHAASVGRRAAYGLAEADLDLSARRVLIWPQGLLGALVAVLAVLAVIVWPVATLAVAIVITSLLLAVLVGFKMWLAIEGAGEEPRLPTRILSDSELPTYTVLVPLYHEAAVVPGLLASLAALDYPPEKLEILVLLEHDDIETREALVAQRPAANVTLVEVPATGPSTKPKACNVGLLVATGELLVIYDAEDRPEPDQLRLVASVFAESDPKVACVQAALNYHNARANLLTRLFALEYSLWFDYVLPGLDALGLPIPLGGTSNHFRTEVLRALGGWDPFNVTEDADLGIRAAVMGTRVRVVASTTWEEATSRIPSFLRQRTRWIKGYMQTGLVHLRHPWRLVRAVGVPQMIGFVLLVVGTPVVFLLIWPLDLLFVASLLVPGRLLTSTLGTPVVAIGLVDLIVGNAMMIYLSMVAVFRRREWGLVLAAVLSPAYWLLHATASLRAVAQLVTRPHFWDKTEHGVSS